MAETDTISPTILFQAASDPQVVATGDILWDSRVQEYLAYFAIYRADMQFGPSCVINDAHCLEMLNLTDQYGKHWRTIPEAVERADAAMAEVEANEVARLNDIYLPFWAATRALLMTPAPTLAALLFKIEIGACEEIASFADLSADPFEIVKNDARSYLSGELA